MGKRTQQISPSKIIEHKDYKEGIVAKFWMFGNGRTCKNNSCFKRK